MVEAGLANEDVPTQSDTKGLDRNTAFFFPCLKHVNSNLFISRLPQGRKSQGPVGRCGSNVDISIAR